jgi:hypothetical protein
MLVVTEDKLRRFSATIFEKLRDVPRLFPKKEAKNVCHVFAAKEPPYYFNNRLSRSPKRLNSKSLNSRREV